MSRTRTEHLNANHGGTPPELLLEVIGSNRVLKKIACTSPSYLLEHLPKGLTLSLCKSMKKSGEESYVNWCTNEAPRVTSCRDMIQGKKKQLLNLA